MKFFLSVLALCTIVLFSCTKSETHNLQGTTLAGTWKLSQMLADPGDGSGTWQPATTAMALRFTETGAIRGNAFPQARHYEVLSDSTIKFIYEDGTFIIYNYTLTESLLSLSGGGCIEACGIRFVRVR